jgi:protein SCO1/2
LNRWLQSRLAAWVAALSLVLSCLASRPALAQGSGPMPKDIDLVPHFGDKVPLETPLVDEAGRNVQLGGYFDGTKPVVLVMAYYECPMLCSLVLNGVTTALRAGGLRPGEDFEVVVVSIDPADTPERAAAKKATYVRFYDRPGAERAMHFTTGKEADVRRIADAVGWKYEYDPVGKQFAHPAGIMVITGAGVISRYFYGVDFSPRDLRLGIVDAANGAVGTPADKLLLLCFHYDPAQGRYGAMTMSLVRGGGLLTVALMVVFGLALRKRERADGQALSGRRERHGRP